LRYPKKAEILDCGDDEKMTSMRKKKKLTDEKRMGEEVQNKRRFFRSILLGLIHGSFSAPGIRRVCFYSPDN
jgi:hypothetical protein